LVATLLTALNLFQKLIPTLICYQTGSK
jgi:hypothetical protein